jgi:hypothetical protein
MVRISSSGICCATEAVVIHTSHAPATLVAGGLKERAMDEVDRDEAEAEEYDEQIEQMIIDNGVLLHTLASLLVRKGVLKQEEIDTEMDRLYEEMDSLDEE